MPIRVNEAEARFRCGVRDFIGPLDEDRWDIPAMPDRPMLGVKAHLRYAAERQGEAGFSAEVPISLTFSHRGYTFELGGRVDGLYEGSEGRRVEEVKSHECSM